jgi:hypothetical protein
MSVGHDIALGTSTWSGAAPVSVTTEITALPGCQRLSLYIHYNGHFTVTRRPILSLPPPLLETTGEIRIVSLEKRMPSRERIKRGRYRVTDILYSISDTHSIDGVRLSVIGAVAARNAWRAHHGAELDHRGRQRIILRRAHVLYSTSNTQCHPLVPFH